MSVLTVSGSAALPNRSLPADYPATATYSARSHLPLRADNIDSYSYTRPAAVNAQPGVPTSHRHSRTISSNIIPADSFSSRQPPASARSSLPSPTYKPQTHSRQSSVSTFNMHRQGTTASNNSAAPRRSTSSRSTNTNSPTSYVALMRKQKATVWCDRSQNIDPRLAQAQRVAKQRAAMEVTGVGSVSARTSTITSGGMVGKIRHGGVPKAPGYSPANMSGAGVPLRLSANEMLGDDEDEPSYGDNGMAHGRSSSGKSSASSAKYRSGYPRPDQGRFSGISTPPSGDTSPGKEGIPELNEAEQGRPNYQRMSKRDSEDSFGAVGDLQAPSALKQAVSEAKKADDLRRRGSVDERAMSMGAGVRLYVANPDLDDD